MNCMRCRWHTANYDNFPDIVATCNCYDSPRYGMDAGPGCTCEKFKRLRRAGDRIILRDDRRNTWMSDDEAEQMVRY